MIPSTNEQYDIGSAEYKIRDMYVSDNSLWIGDKAKISFDTTEDKLTFRKRKASDTFIPAKIIDLANASGEGLNTTISITNHILEKSYTPSRLGAMKLHHWLRYAKDFQSNIKLSEIFANTESDFDSTSTAEGTFSGTGAITVPVGTTEQQPSTGVAGMIRFNSTSNRLEVYNGTVWQSVGGASATGGTITDIGGYRIHTFTFSASPQTFTVISSGEFDYLVVAGGGGGGSGVAGGGGAGGMLTGRRDLVSGSYIITVGAGGVGGIVNDTYRGTSGDDSSIANLIVANGGGAGASSQDNGPGYGALTGGSGGGGSHYTYNTGISSGNSGTPGQGNNGGNSVTNSQRGGGGGGAGSAGSISTSGGNGGIGLQSSISGTNTYYAGGGGGGANGTPGTGGNGGGGNGGNTNANGNDGTDGLGGGGGGGWTFAAGNGGSGGDGIVIIRYLI